MITCYRMNLDIILVLEPSGHEEILSPLEANMEMILSGLFMLSKKELGMSSCLSRTTGGRKKA